MVRLYGNSLEDKDYPIPGKHFTMTSRESRPDPVLKDISVHHLIRQEGSLHASEINDFDDKFSLFRKDKSYWPTIRDIRRYKHITSEAAQEELKKHDIIFCTTAVTTSPRFIKGTRGKVFQLIIDEAGMCTEPESIAAIIATKAKQVVLIGDHKQLSPVICSTHAAELGLQVSLFERYADLAKMLRLQYRMVILARRYLVTYYSLNMQCKTKWVYFFCLFFFISIQKSVNFLQHISMTKSWKPNGLDLGLQKIR